jgi:hypothetical protein
MRYIIAVIVLAVLVAKGAKLRESEVHKMQREIAEMNHTLQLSTGEL